MTLAQLKKAMPVGTPVRLVRTLQGRCNSRRKVTHVHGAAFTLTDSQGKEWRLLVTDNHSIEKTPAGFRVQWKLGDQTYSVVEYEWEPQAPEPAPAT